jgi:hypothetical protein
MQVKKPPLAFPYIVRLKYPCCGMRVIGEKVVIIWVFFVSMTLLISGCHTATDATSAGSGESSKKDSSYNKQKNDEVLEAEVDEIQPLIIWGEDGLPVLNDAALPSSNAVETDERDSKAKSGSKRESLPDFAEKDKPSMEFTIKTNITLSRSPMKTRLQEFYEFTSRLDRKHSIQLPDMVTVSDSRDVAPLFSEDELTSTNRSEEPKSLMTSFETKIRLVNENLRFVVLDYSYEPMPPVETRLSVYRANSRIGLVKVTGPVKDGSVVAIILEGSPLVGDVVLREIWQ